MGLIVVQGRMPLVIGGSTRRGVDGRDIEVGASATHIQWRREGDAAWMDLIPLEQLTGQPGMSGSDGSNGANGANGADGVGIAGVVIDASKHLIVTMTDGTKHDAGALPSSDEVDALGRLVSEQAALIAGLLARIEVLESYHTVPPNALTTASGEPLVDSAGNYLTLGAAV